MDLKDFIKTAIADITGAISELQQELDNGAIVNPILSEGKDSYSTIDGDKRIIERLNFDVAVTVSSLSNTEAGAKAGISVLGAKIESKSNISTEHVSRLAFSVPIVFPHTDTGTGSHKFGHSIEQYKPKRPTN